MCLFYHKKYLFLFFLLLALGIIALLPTLKNEEISFLLLTLWILLLGVVLEYFSRRFFKNLHQALTENCNPEKYIDLFNHCIIVRKLPDKNSIRLLLGLSSAIIETGDYDKSLELLKTISMCKKSLNKVDELLLYNNMAVAYKNKMDKENADKYFDACNLMFDTARDDLPEKVRLSYTNILAARDCLKELNEGRYDGVEKAMVSLYENLNCELYRVHYKYDLGKVFIQLSEKDKAKSAFDYVVRHGNKLFTVKLAKAEIQSLLAK